MKLKLAAVAVALLLVGTGAAMAAPGNAPDGVPADEHSDDHADDELTDGDEADNASDERRGPPSDVPASGSADDPRGPPADLPEQVPDFVGGIHDAVRDHVADGLDGADLGDRISSLTPDDSEDGEDVDNETEDVDNAPDDASVTDAGNASDAPEASTPADDE